MTIADELFETADAAAGLLARVRDDRLRAPLQAIRKACEEAQRAWCGSNIGYHACVYFAGLQPHPPEAQFSAEWGLMDRWPTHQPHPGWRIMDRQTVIGELLSRAGNPDLDVITADLAPFQERFSSLKERTISLLTAALAEQPDEFIDRKLKQVEPLKLANPQIVERSLMPKGQIWKSIGNALE